jgi:WhiB family redox-sensing transcriptional regulator
MAAMADRTEAWMAEARCTDLDSGIFFPSDSLGVQRAVEICKACPVRVPCLEHALENGISIGIWGGESERSRRRIRAARRREARSVR